MKAPEIPDSPQPAAQLIAYAYLSREGDHRNVLQLTEGALHIVYRGRNRAFSLAYIQQLALEHRKLWLPLIGGGILASLCLLALFQTFSMPFRLLSGVMAGLLLIWWGYRGSMALVVYEQRHHTDFLLPAQNKGLALFVAFANRLIRRYPEPLEQYCLPLSAVEWQQLQQEGVLELVQARDCQPRERLRYLPAAGLEYWLAFDPLRMGGRLRWSLQGQELLAQLQGRIARQEVEEFIRS
ncbi:hypothetical protein [Cesiribacter andamanensis]|uniref:Uncharacterized protein n=1 Tax=Cesiribacter andamanensis AMV16 TaxID=1279009 RepID=M7NSW5_9BACT|nr:hypothetical protein [Cesiribacter andamanensis]EMR01584.1 hypothetical protein ADICEAN_03289 [Cesiribacter andamanensis AMV16]